MKIVMPEWEADYGLATGRLGGLGSMSPTLRPLLLAATAMMGGARTPEGSSLVGEFCGSLGRPVVLLTYGFPYNLCPEDRWPTPFAFVLLFFRLACLSDTLYLFASRWIELDRTDGGLARGVKGEVEQQLMYFSRVFETARDHARLCAVFP